MSPMESLRCGCNQLRKRTSDDRKWLDANPATTAMERQVLEITTNHTIPEWKKRTNTGILATMTLVKRVRPMARNVQPVSCAPIAGWASSVVVALNLSNITAITTIGGTKIFRITITITTTTT